jgi:hypothetical protein
MRRRAGCDGWQSEGGEVVGEQLAQAGGVDHADDGGVPDADLEAVERVGHQVVGGGRDDGSQGAAAQKVEPPPADAGLC